MKNNKHYACESPFEMVDHDGVKYTLTVEQDNYADSPREWDNICTMVCWHHCYYLGDKHTFEDPFELMQHLYLDVTGKHWIDEHYSERWQDVYDALKETNLILIKPLNVYEHSGITISTSNAYPYNDRWDAGCVGFVYVTKKTIFLECAGITEENWKERADELIEGEVETYDQYLRSDVYGYTLTKTEIEEETCPHCGEVILKYKDEDVVDSCWGFYGDCLEDNGILDNLGNLKFVED